MQVKTSAPPPSTWYSFLPIWFPRLSLKISACSSRIFVLKSLLILPLSITRSSSLAPLAGTCTIVFTPSTPKYPGSNTPNTLLRIEMSSACSTADELPLSISQKHALFILASHWCECVLLIGNTSSNSSNQLWSFVYLWIIGPAICGGFM